MTMRIGVTGGRTFHKSRLIVAALRQMPADAVLVHGAAPGADTACAEWWGDFEGRTVEPHPADWDGPCVASCYPGHRRVVLGMPDRCPAAGPRRNQEMVDSGLDLLITFPGGRGTADMTRRARAAGIRIFDPLWGTFMTAQPPTGQKLSDSEWFALAAELDFISWRLTQMQEALATRAPISRAVDAATGYEDELADEAQALMARSEEIKVILASAEVSS